MDLRRLSFCFLCYFLECHWHSLACQSFEDVAWLSFGRFYFSDLLLQASFELRARGARLVSPRGFQCLSPRGLILVWREIMLYLLCTFLDLSVVELAEHSPRPFGQGVCVCVCVHPRRPFGRGVQERGGGGRLLETSRRLIIVVLTIIIHIIMNA